MSFLSLTVSLISHSFTGRGGPGRALRQTPAHRHSKGRLHPKYHPVPGISVAACLLLSQSSSRYLGSSSASFYVRVPGERSGWEVGSKGMLTPAHTARKNALERSAVGLIG